MGNSCACLYNNNNENQKGKKAKSSKNTSGDVMVFKKNGRECNSSKFNVLVQGEMGIF